MRKSKTPFNRMPRSLAVRIHARNGPIPPRKAGTPSQVKAALNYLEYREAQPVWDAMDYRAYFFDTQDDELWALRQVQHSGRLSTEECGYYESSGAGGWGDA